MNTRQLIAAVAASIVATAALADQAGQTTGDPVSVNPRVEQPAQAAVKTSDASDAQRDAIRAEARAAILDKLAHPARIAEYNFGPSGTQSAYKTEPAPSTSVAQH